MTVKNFADPIHHQGAHAIFDRLVSPFFEH